MSQLVRDGPARLCLRGTGLFNLSEVPLTERSEELDARDNAISDASEAARAAQLRVLLLGRNILRTAPLLRHMTHLQVLDLSDNKLESISLEGLVRLRALNLAGNCLKAAESLKELSDCRHLEALDLSRNDINDLTAVFEQLQSLPLRLLSVLGNPRAGHCSPPANFALAVWNARVVEGRQADAAALHRSLSDEAGILWDRSPAARRSQSAAIAAEEFGRPIARPRVGPADSVSSIPVQVRREDAGSSVSGGQDREAVANSPRDSAADRDTTTDNARRAFEEGSPHGILDSADDMTSGSSGSESTRANLGGVGRAPSQALPGLADRQDSANYQPRPPALAERQDSAQNLQALAEAEAELTRTGSSGENAAPARQDSAHELDEASRSPTSPDHLQATSYAPARLSEPTQAHRDAEAPGVNPRQSSASELEALRQPHGIPEPTSAALLDTPPTASLEAARLIYQSTPPGDRGEEWVGLNPFRGDEAQNMSPTPRQDSALDSLAEARRAVLADMPRSGSMPTSDPLQQARQLLQTTLRSPGSLPLLPDQGSPARMGSPQPAILQGRGTAAGTSVESPFGVTPLSPQWTVSQLQPSFSQQLPRITSGVPFAPNPSNPDAASKGLAALGEAPESSEAGQIRGGLLEEARRVVLGTCKSEPSRPAAKPPLPAGVGADVGPSRAEGSPRLGRWGEPGRETPYPDSPLAAGVAGSRSDSAFFERQASQDAALGNGPADVAESSQAASAMA